MAEIDKKYLAGLKFRTAKPGKDGGTQAIEQDLQPKHVLDHKDCGDHVVIVAADGRKHKVSKKEAKKEGEQK